MLIYSILDEEKENLKVLNKNSQNVDIVVRFLTELKKHKVTLNNIQEIKEEIEDKYLKYKIDDIEKIYSKYEKSLSGNFIDDTDVLTLLSEKIKDTTMFDNTNIYIDEFSGFTTQEYKVIEELLKKAKQLTVTICTDKNEETTKENDIFYFNKKTYNKIKEIAIKNKIKIEETIFLEELHRFKNEELACIESNFSTLKRTIYFKECNNIKLFLASNPYSEIEYVAKEILKLVRDKNYRYKEIGIITKNIDTYSSQAKAIFSKFNIPIFIDEKKDLTQNIVVKFILAFLDVLAKNWSYDSMFSYIKTGLINIDDDELYNLENYCKKWGIKENKWYKDNWTYEKLNENQEKINETRIKIVTPILNFKNELDKSKTVEDITNSLYNFIVESQIEEKLNEKIEKSKSVEMSNEYNSSFKVLINVLDEMVLLFGNKKISFEKYKEILKVGLAESSVGKIPAVQDQVIMSDVDRSRTHKLRAVFVIGINDGVFPSVNKDEGFINDNDRELLKKFEIELAKTTEENMYEEQFKLYKTFTIAEEKLFLSYVSSDKSGKSCMPSNIIKKVKNIFKSLKEESNIVNEKYEITTKEASFSETMRLYKKYLNGEITENNFLDALSYYYKFEKDRVIKTLNGMYFSNIPEKLNKENLEKLYGNILHTTVSRLEKYKSCPFSFYLKYGLKIDENPEFRIQMLDTGSLMHDIIDEFFKYILENGIDIKNVIDEEIKTIVDKIVIEKLSMSVNYIFISSEKYKLLVLRLKRLLYKALKYIIEGIKISKFVVLGSEIEFKKDAKYNPIIISIDDCKKVEITGKIDRVDVAENNGEKYVRIIDYKSSSKMLDLNQVIAGLQLQLLTYLDAASEKENAIPAGVLYFNLLDPIITSDKNLTDEEIEEAVRKKFKMQGYVLNDIDIIKMMDTNLEKGYSNIVPVYIDSNNNVSTTRSSVLKKEEFENLQKYIKKTIKEISIEILNGKIDIKPYNRKGKTPCEYCNYNSICCFNTKDNSYQYIDNRNKEEILEIIKEQSQ